MVMSARGFSGNRDVSAGYGRIGYPSRLWLRRWRLGILIDGEDVDLVGVAVLVSQRRKKMIVFYFYFQTDTWSGLVLAVD
jgi:hypothetical protein